MKMLRFMTATLLFIFWPRILLGQFGFFYSMNKPAAVTGGIAYVSAASNWAGAGATNYTSFPVNVVSVPAGATFLAAAKVVNNVVTLTLTDSAGGSFTSLGSTLYNSGADTFQMWCLTNASAGSHTITLGISALSSGAGLFVATFSGANTTNSCTSTPQVTTGYGPTGNTTAVTTSANNMVVGFVAPPGAALSSAPGYTIVPGTGSGIYLMYAFQSSAGSYAPAMTFAAPTEWVSGTQAINP